jgi:glycogen operon protein
MGDRLSGSADLFRAARRPPATSINFVTSHDGFTLADLVSYQTKHNYANGENNRDGSDFILSNNFGVEGPTRDADINAVRSRERKNLLATLLVSLGVPMVTAGDEMGRTQRGNNNAYAQDNRVSWLDWDLDDERRSLLDFVTRLTRLRKELGPLRRARHATGIRHDGAVGPDLAWFRPDGVEMRWTDWIHPEQPVFSYRLLGRTERDLKHARQELQGCCVVFNSGEAEIPCVLPTTPDGEWRWDCALSSAPLDEWRDIAPARSVTIFVLRSGRRQRQAT